MRLDVGVVMEMRSELTAIEQWRIIRVEAFDGDTFGITLKEILAMLLSPGNVTQNQNQEEDLR